MKTRAWLNLLSAAIGAIMPWLASPWLTGHREPWDADGLFYVVALIVAEAAASLVAPRLLWTHYLSAYIAQLCYEMVFLRVGPLFVFGVLLLLGYCIFFVVGAGAAAMLRGQLGKRAPVT